MTPFLSPRNAFLRGLLLYPPVTPRSDSDEESPIQLRGLDITPSKLPQEGLRSFWGKFERGLFPLSSNRGGELTLL